MARRSLAVGLLLPVLLPLASCVGAGDRARGEQQLAFGLDATSGRVVMVVHPCPGQSLTAATVWSMDNKGEELDRKLWSVTATGAASPGATSLRLVVGQAPADFTEDTPLGDDLPAGAPLDATIQLDSEIGRGFRVRDLRKDMLLVDPPWFHNKRYVTSDEFEQVNAKECGGA